MSSDVRQFIYLDSQAVNSLLASMSMAVPERIREVVEETEKEGDEVSGEAKLNLPSFITFGGGGKTTQSERSRDLSEIERYITSQYRYDILERALQESDTTEVYDLDNTEDFSELKPGDVVKISGFCTTDPLYPLLGALEHITEATSEAPSGSGLVAQLIQSQSDFGQVQQFYQLLYGGWVGLELTPNNNGHNFGLAINEDLTTVDCYREFRGLNEYTVLARVQDQIQEGEKWDLVEALRVIAGISPDVEADQFRAEIIGRLLRAIDEQDNDGFELPELDPSEMFVEGPATILNPIALYW
ncbi:MULTISPECIES: DUF6414 family protein [Haloferax]|uniref:Uncharacterized protein n=1 Tax=Haloferax sp. Atlit-48N TaxID=2077198 RepID=A0ACD5HVM6_9EURY|nr:hypothetical protein [Haloferax alexandrinus]